MRRVSTLGDTRFARQILALDQKYVRSLTLNLFGDTAVDKAEFVLNCCYYKPEFVCSLCGAGNTKRGNRPASFFPTQVGYLYTCLNCNPCLSLYHFLLQVNPEVAEKYRSDRWENKLAGEGFNCPALPLNLRKEYYQRKEAEQKEANRIAYLKRNGLG